MQLGSDYLDAIKILYAFLLCALNEIIQGKKLENDGHNST